ncbi:MAG TPA: tetratricopeptide repeat protein, partial [Chryseosolibacter sp.]|nr:tetratricopeptide repeat protein [Chryseosolibacter sp.]
MFRFLIFWLSMSATGLVYGQRQEIDSLQTKLAGMRPGIERVDLLNNISSALYNYDVVRAHDRAVEAYELARSIDYVDGMRYALILKAFYFFGSANYSEALNYHRQSAKLETRDDDLKAYNLVMTGNVFQALAQYDSALKAYMQAIRIEQTLGSEQYLAYAYKNLGRLHVIQWRNDEAEMYFRLAIDLYKKNNSKRSIADTWYALAEVKSNVGAYDEALQLVNQACAVGEELDDEFLKLYCYINKGEISHNTGEYADALDQLFLAMEKIKDVELPNVLARLYQDLGDVYEALGQNEVALNYFLESLKVAQRLGIKHEIAKVKSGIAWIYKNQKNFKLAHQFINESLELRQEIGDDHGISNCYNVRGVIYLVEKKYDSALVSLDRSLEIRTRLKYKYGIAACLFNKAIVLEERKDYKQALDLQLRALEYEHQIGNKFSIGISYNGVGSIYTKLNDFRKAAHYLRLAEQMAERTGSLTLQMNNSGYWAELYAMTNDHKRAL